MSARPAPDSKWLFSRAGIFRCQLRMITPVANPRGCEGANWPLALIAHVVVSLFAMLTRAHWASLGGNLRLPCSSLPFNALVQHRVTI